MPAPTELAISNAGKLQGNKENEMIPVSNTHAPLDSCKPEPSDFLIQPGVVTSSPQPAKNTKAVVSAPTSTRKSGRQRKPRIVYVNGQPVLKSNCYELESGEPSVFDRELRNGADAGAMEYSSVAPVRKQAVATISNPKSQARPKPQGDTPILLHNRNMKAEKEIYLGRRALFLSHHAKLLQPFMSAKSMAALQARANSAQKFIPSDPVECQPECIKATMRDYQVESLRWITKLYENGVNCILGDEMGLGKTLQTIAFLANLKEHNRAHGPFLVVVPLSVLSSWMQELSTWCPSLRAVKLHCSHAGEVMRLKKEIFSNPSNFDVAVTTYEMVRSKDMSGLLRSLNWRVLVLDEGHRIKNENTELSAALRLIRHQFCLLLTGTPLQNNLHELYALLNFLLPDIFDDSEPFDNCFDLGKNKVDNSQLHNAHHLMQLLCLRRIKAHINLHLPPKVETRINCPLSEMQLFWYQRLLLKNSSHMLHALGQSTSVKHDKESNDWRKLQQLLMQLRKCINHPYNFPGAEPDFDGNTSEDIVTASGKMMVLDQLLRKLKEKGHRVVLFSQFNTMLDIIEDYLNMRGYKYRRLDGSTNRVQRRIDISLFNRPGSDTFIYIINTRAGGLGINLQTADTCILYDSDWNPQVDVQAMARVHRIGQTKTVHVYRLFSGDTVEERVLLRADKKLFLDKMVNRDCGASPEEAQKMDVKELLSMLEFGADRIFKGDGGRMPTDKEFEELMDRSDAGQSKATSSKEAGHQLCGGATRGAAGSGLTNAKLTADKFAAGGVEQAPLSSFLLNGVDYSEYRSATNKDLAEEWNRQHRNRTSTVVMIDGYAVSKSSIQDQQRLVSWKAPQPKVKREPRIHSSYCQHCWDGGDLFLCNSCPSAYHAECLGMTQKDMKSSVSWCCPHHSCVGCGRKSHSAGGMLFACEGCSNSYCEDCLPDTAEIIGSSVRLENLNFIQPKTICYIRCDGACVEFCQRPGFDTLGVESMTDEVPTKKIKIEAPKIKIEAPTIE